MSLTTPVPEVKLTPNPPRLTSIRWYGRLWLLLKWLFYRPQMLEEYEKQWLFDDRPKGKKWHQGFWDSYRWLFNNREISHFFILECLVQAFVILGVVVICGLCLLPLMIQPEQQLLPFLLTIAFISITTTWLLSAILNIIGRSTTLGFVAGTLLGAGAVLAFMTYHASFVAFQSPQTTSALVIMPALFGLGFGIGSSIFDARVDRHWLTTGELAEYCGVVGILALILLMAPWLALGEQQPALAPDLLMRIGIAILFSMLMFIFGFWRIDDWLLAQPRKRKSAGTGRAALNPVPYVTTMHLSRIDRVLESWLENNWRVGLKAVWRLWRNTRLQRMLVTIIQRELRETPENDSVIMRIAAISDMESEDPVMQKAFEELLFQNSIRPRQSEAMGAEIAAWRKMIGRSFSWRPGHKPAPAVTTTASQRMQDERQRIWMREVNLPAKAPKLPTDTPSAAASAGFYHLRNGYLASAEKAFQSVPGKVAGAKEMSDIASACLQLWGVVDLFAAAPPKLPKRPSSPMRKTIWDAFDELSGILHFAWQYQEIRDATLRAWSLQECQKRLQEFKIDRLEVKPPPAVVGMRPKKDRIPLTERRFFTKLIKDWESNLRKWTVRPPQRKPLKKISNPFYFAEPNYDLKGGAIIGRNTELNELAQSWTPGNLQMVVIKGQPLIGKTSLILNAQRRVTGNIALAWCKLGQTHPFRSVEHQLLYSVCEALSVATGIPSPPATDPRWPTDAFQITESYCRQIATHETHSGIVLVLDDFDSLVSGLSPLAPIGRSMGFLRHLNATFQPLTIVFSTTMPRPYFVQHGVDPFAQANRQLNLNYFGADPNMPGSERTKPTLQLLNDQLKTQRIRFHDDTAQRLHTMTNGHPYLIELIGYFIVERFNQRVDRDEADPLFGDEDVRKALTNPSLRNNAQIYYNRLLESIRRYLTPANATTAEQTLRWMAALPGDVEIATWKAAILTATAPGPASPLPPVANFSQFEETVEHLLELGILTRVTEAGAHRVRISVPMFRYWLRTI